MELFENKENVELSIDLLIPAAPEHVGLPVFRLSSGWLGY